MPQSKKSRRAHELTLDALDALGNFVPRRVISDAERTSIVETTHRLLRGAIFPFDEFAKSRPRWRRRASVEHSQSLFGLDRPDSSLMKPRLEWKMSLSERVVTETLCKLLNGGGPKVRALRIEAFLRALGFGNAELGSDTGGLASAQVFSEVPALDGRRIDLKIVWRDVRNREQVLIVEAKFGHQIMDGQLRCYRDTTRKDHPKAERYYLILALHEKKMLSVNGRDGHWRFCSWRDMWLRFETTRPVENDLSLQLFLHALWYRIGRLNPKDEHAPL